MKFKALEKWFSGIIILEDVQIPRYNEVNYSIQMHVFDACKRAYAACIFFMTKTPEGVIIQ